MRRPVRWVSHSILALLVAQTVSAENPATRPTSQPASQPVAATLTVEIKDLRNARGDLIFGVFKQADGFPTQSDKSVFWEVRATRTNDKTIVFTAHLPPGRYGASVLHDENRSGNMEHGWGGIPKEGYGVTNNPKPRFRAATFQEATFDLPAEGAKKTISVQYF
jgi:uncharacterized protein (DUF2141 family)